MKFFNGNGILKKIATVVAVISTVFVLYWKTSDRIEVKISEAVAASETRVVSSLDKFQRQQDTRYWLQLRDTARMELKRAERGLRHHPDDLTLLEEREYWRGVYEQAKEQLDKILNPR